MPFDYFPLAREITGVSGVTWSAMDAPVGPSPAELAARRDASMAAVQAQRHSPRGLFRTALHGIAAMPTYEGEADRLRGIFNRELADEREPLNTHAVGACITILNKVPGAAARAALDALAELLLADGDLRRAA